MPFKKGNKLSPGRKGYEFEDKQLERMRKVVDKYLLIAEKMLGEKKGKLTKTQLDNLKSIVIMCNKILDKLHANKTDITSGGLPIIPIIEISKEGSEKYAINTTSG